MVQRLVAWIFTAGRASANKQTGASRCCSVDFKPLNLWRAKLWIKLWSRCLSSSSGNAFFIFQETWECYRFSLNVCNPQTSDWELLIIFPRYKSGSQIFTGSLRPATLHRRADALLPSPPTWRRIWKYFSLNPNGLSRLPVPIPSKPDSSLLILFIPLWLLLPSYLFVCINSAGCAFVYETVY